MPTHIFHTQLGRPVSPDDLLPQPPNPDLAPRETRRRISIVIPCLNDAELLARCLQSLNNQTIPADEIIVVDNGSTDNSADVARSHGACVVDEPRRGITWATRTGLDAASGDQIARTDADIVAPEDFVANLHRAWDAAESSEAQGGRRVAGVTGTATFELPAPWNKLASALYVGAYRRSTGSALGHSPFFGTNYCVDAAWWREVRDSVDFSDTFVHEDLHLSYAVRPNETVWVDDRIRVWMDPRALVGWKQVWVRFKRGFHTMFSNWRTSPPQQRLVERGKISLP